MKHFRDGNRHTIITWLNCLYNNKMSIKFYFERVNQPFICRFLRCTIDQPVTRPEFISCCLIKTMLNISGVINISKSADLIDGDQFDWYSIEIVNWSNPSPLSLSVHIRCLWMHTKLMWLWWLNKKTTRLFQKLVVFHDSAYNGHNGKLFFFFLINHGFFWGFTSGANSWGDKENLFRAYPHKRPTCQKTASPFFSVQKRIN